jgi:hypothetical protein
MLSKIRFLLPLLVLAACVSTGPVAIENHQPFPGLANALADLPAGGTLHVFLIHGMRTEQDESEPNLRASIQARLGLTEIETHQQALPMPRPEITLDGHSLWPSQNTWSCGAPLQNCDAPYLDIATYSAPGGKEAVFYSLNYWGVLVWIKCKELVTLDTKLTGDFNFSHLGNAEYCNQRFAARDGFPIGTEPVSSAPALVDHALKNLILDWGFGDAVIVMSGYEAVLREAVREGLDAEAREVVRRSLARGGTPRPVVSSDLATAFDDPRKQQAQAYAIVSESLGSYVVLDTLERASPQELQSGGQSILCRVTQVHMLANQISLLRISRIRARLAGSQMESEQEVPSANAAAGPCPNQSMPRSVVAYHDPSDLLTFYTKHGTTGRLPYETRLNTETINVVAPFAPLIIPGILADPVQAHTAGQETDARIQDMVAFGSSGVEPNHTLVPEPALLH